MMGISLNTLLPEAWEGIMMMQKRHGKGFNGLTKMQLDIWGCKYHELILGKPSADYYIDDKAVNSDDFFKT